MNFILKSRVTNHIPRAPLIIEPIDGDMIGTSLRVLYNKAYQRGWSDKVNNDFDTNTKHKTDNVAQCYYTVLNQSSITAYSAVATMVATARQVIAEHPERADSELAQLESALRAQVSHD